MTQTAQAKVLIVVVFVVGIVTGGVLIDLYQTRVQGSDGEAQGRSQRGADATRQRFEDYLELTDAQRVALRAILERTEGEFDALRAQTRPMYQVLRDRSRTEIREILTDEQQELYDRWRSDLERRRSSERGDRDEPADE